MANLNANAGMSEPAVGAEAVKKTSAASVMPVEGQSVWKKWWLWLIIVLVAAGILIWILI